MFGFYRIAAAVPSLKVADVDYNVGKILELINRADKEGAVLVVFPELCITGYTCGDLFHQTRLAQAVQLGIERLCSATRDVNTTIIVGAPLPYRTGLYNCALLIQDGTIKGVVPKSFLPNYKEFYEKRWFSPGKGIASGTITINDTASIPFGTDIVFDVDKNLKIGIEICEDLWNVLPPSSLLAVAGATVIANLSASNDLVSKAGYRRALVQGQSARCVAAYVYTSSGVTESTTDVVYGGHALIAENGVVLAENERFVREDQLVLSDVDCERLSTTRITETSFSDNEVPEFRYIPLRPPAQGKMKPLLRSVPAHPFIPSNCDDRDARCEEIFNIQVSGLAKRIEHTAAKTAVIGVSGGLDSTLALLVIREAFRLLKIDSTNIIAVTMPGFGTSKRTYNNALKLTRTLKVDLREIDISSACNGHFHDIEYDPDQRGVTYENVQARERTQILMDLANKEGGIVVGTGDLSEIALGWSTYSGDHISMYAVNCGVPKTLIKYLIDWNADRSNESKLQKVLRDILTTPISPELLPGSGDDDIAQRTEDIIGPYELHDFFLYHMLKYGATPAKIRFLAKIAFNRAYTQKAIDRWLKIFIKRFFSQQFKRSCTPDGPKVGTISLSPRGDWKMPSDASSASWLGDL